MGLEERSPPGNSRLEAKGICLKPQTERSSSEALLKRSDPQTKIWRFKDG